VEEDQRFVCGVDKLVLVGLEQATAFDVHVRLSLDTTCHKPMKAAFIWNKNVHKLPQSLRGLVVYYSNGIWCIIKARGYHAVAIRLFPWGDSFELRRTCLKDCGLPLQQVCGQLLSPWKSGFKSPLLSQAGFLKMSPDGPDFFEWMPPIPMPPEIDLPPEDPFVHRVHQPGPPPSKTVGVVYVLDNPLNRLTRGTKDTFSVPLGSPVRQPATDNRRFSLQEFAELSKEAVDYLLELGGSLQELFDVEVRHLSCRLFTLVVPTLVNGSLRIKVVSSDECKSLQTQGMQELEHNGDHYLFGHEDSDLKNTPGCLVSVWGNSPLASNPQLTCEFASAMLDVYGPGYGSRRISQCMGMNLCRDSRNTQQPHPSPFVADEDIGDHQYFNEHLLNYPLLQPVLEKRINELTSQALRLQQEINPVMKPFAPLCTRKIITCGCRPFPKRKPPPFSFACTVHVDFCDELKGVLKEMLRKEMPVYPLLERLMQLKGACFPTTCAYQFIHKNPAEPKYTHVEQMFAMEGLGLAMCITHGIAHNFQAAAFSHRSCLCRVWDLHNLVLVANNDDDFLLFAWGKGASKNTALNYWRRRRRQQAQASALEEALERWLFEEGAEQDGNQEMEDMDVTD